MWSETSVNTTSLNVLFVYNSLLIKSSSSPSPEAGFEELSGGSIVFMYLLAFGIVIHVLNTTLPLSN